MDQTPPERAAVAAPGPNATHLSAERRSQLWRAVAGMAFALALAAGIVTVDLSEQLVERITHYRSRVASLSRSVDKLKRQKSADEKQLADARVEIETRKAMDSQDRIKAVMLAPDRRNIKLVAASPEVLASGTATISVKAGGGALNLRGLPTPPEPQVYGAWWMLKDAPPAKAAEFKGALDGRVSEYLEPPPRGFAVESLSITLEPAANAIAPSGAVKLQGKTQLAIREERSAGGSKH